jgi:putative ABC transport system permease protein
MGINSILVQHENGFGSGANLTASLNQYDIQSISRINGVDRAMPLMASVNKTRLLDETINSFTWGINSNAREIISLEALHGRLISTQDTASRAMVTVIDEELAIASYGRSNVVGKTARILLGGAYHDFEIVGVAKSGISSLQSALSGIIPNFVYVPITTMQMLTGRTGYDKIAVMANDCGDVIPAISNTITQNRGENSGLIVSNLLQQKKGLENILQTITIVLSLIAGISLLVSGLTVMTTMLVSVNERRREIGIKKSIGAKDFDIAREFLLESMALSGMGSAIGAGLGLGVTAAGCAILGIAFTLDLTPILMAVAFAVGLGGVFGAYPAIKAAKLQPIEALRQ